MSEPAIVTFGRYKGQPVDVLLQDRGYCEWLLARDWFVQKHAVLHQTIINFGGPPQDSPEHNQMQAKYLDGDYCLALAMLLDSENDYRSPVATKAEMDWLNHARADFSHLLDESVEPASAVAVGFEDGGWDVTFRVLLPRLTVAMRDIPSCECGPCDHECPEVSVCRLSAKEGVPIPPPFGALDDKQLAEREGRYRYCPHRSCKDRVTGEVGRAHHKGCRWHGPDRYRSPSRSLEPVPGHPMDWWRLGRAHGYGSQQSPSFAVELKPDLGDDFPSVLRQVQRHKYAHGGCTRVVVARRSKFEEVTWSQVKEIFATANIVLLREDEIESARAAEAIPLGPVQRNLSELTPPRLERITLSGGTLVHDNGAEIFLTPRMAEDLATELIYWVGIPRAIRGE